MVLASARACARETPGAHPPDGVEVVSVADVRLVESGPQKMFGNGEAGGGPQLGFGRVLEDTAA